MTMIDGQRFKAFGGKLERAEGEREIVARITTTAVDRDGDVILPSGMDLTEFKANPVMLLAHNAEKLPIGRWISARKESSGVVMTGTLASRPPDHPPAAEWLPDTVLYLVREGFLRGVSIGFRPLDGGVRMADTKDVARFGEGVKAVISRWSLLEVSIVPIPANQEALITAVGKGLLIGSRMISILGLDIKPKGVLRMSHPVSRVLRLAGKRSA
jgi:HK97 family phage prohead protease